MTIRGWFRTNASLIKDSETHAEQVAKYQEEAIEAVAELMELREQLALAPRVRDVPFPVTAMDQHLGAPPAWLAPSAELLREKARADALESRVHQLQTANMAYDQPR